MDQPQADVISPIELEDIVNILSPTIELERIGNREWSRQMSMMEELNVQAAVEAGRGGEENVRQTLVEKQKMPLIVHEILVTEIWRENVLPRILKQAKPESSFQVLNISNVWANDQIIFFKFTSIYIFGYT